MYFSDDAIFVFKKTEEKLTNRNGRYLSQRTVITTSYNWRDQTIRMLTDRRMNLKFNTIYRQVHGSHFLVSSFLSFRCLCTLGSRTARSPMCPAWFTTALTYLVYYEERHLRYSCLFTTLCLPIIYVYTSRLLLVGTILYDIQMPGFVFF